MASFDDILKKVARTPEPPVTTPFGGTDRFELRRVLGEGAFGVVYSAHDRERGQDVALKVLKGLDAREIQRLKNEFRSIAELVHPNLVRLHELICDEGHWFFTMDLVDGVTIIDGVANSNESRVRRAFAQLAAGVCAVHRAGKLHRDLKPANVLIAREAEQVVVLDFGLATDVGVGTTASMEHSMAGTPAYMAPEQAGGACIDRAADWYAVGVLLFEALTGELPHRGDSLAELISMKATHDGPAPSTIRPETPADLDGLCAALLRREPGARPDGVEVLSRLTDTNVPELATRAPQKRSEEIFVGRVEAMTRLEEGFRIAAGSAVSVAVRGDAGVGKTALCEKFLASLEGRATVLRGRCYERESVPYKALDGIVDELARHLRALPRAKAAGLMPRDIHLLTRLFPVMGRVEALQDVPKRKAAFTVAEELRRRAARVLKELLARLADRGPLVLFIDDLQWGDVDSAHLLTELFAPPDAPSLLLIASLRGEGAIAALAHEGLTRAGVRESSHTHLDIDVSPLSPTEAELLAVRLGAGSKAAELARESAGHPLFLRQLAELSDRSERKPDTLLNILWDRICHLSSEAAALLETIAVAGRPVPLGVGFEAAGIDRFSPTVVDMLRSEHLVRTDGPHRRHLVDVYHDHIRVSVLANLRPDDTRGRHLRLAQALERSSDADPDALALHFYEGGDTEQAGRFAMLAGDRAVSALAFDRAADAYRRAVECTVGSQQAAARLKLAEALTDAGRGPEAGRALRAVAAEMEGLEAIDLRRRASTQLLGSGHVAEGMEILDSLLEELRLPHPRTKFAAIRAIAVNTLRYALVPPKLRVRAPEGVAELDKLRIDACDSIARSLECVDPLKAAAFGVRGARLALRRGDPVRIARVLPALADCATFMGLPSAHELFQRAETLARRVEDPVALAAVHRYRGADRLVLDGKYGEAADGLSRAVSAMQERGGDVISHLQMARKQLCHALVRCGRLRDAFALGAGGVRLAMERGDLIARGEFVGMYQVPMLLAADEADEARALLAEPKPAEGIMAVDLYWHLGLSDVWAYLGDHDAGCAHWDSGRPLLEQHGLMDLPATRTELLRGYLNSVFSAGAPWNEVWRLLKPIRKLKLPFSRAVVAGLLGMQAARDGRLDDARGQLENAVRHYEEVAMALDAASCRFRLGKLVGGERGERLIADASAVMRAEGVVNADRWSRLTLPTL